MTILYAFPEQVALAKSLCKTIGIELADWELRNFPDGESYVRILSASLPQSAIILCSLNQPNAKTLPLLFLARTLRELGTSKITLVAPYLGYMRQDIRFKPGEAITSTLYARLLSTYIDEIITIDPHLHRHKNLEEIYSCACTALSAAPLIAAWITTNVENPLVIGPDAESEQWVKMVAEPSHAPYIILKKSRHGDCDVDITLPAIQQYKNCTPVLVDDIVSTASTMLKTIELLQERDFTKTICLATHGVFANRSYEKLQKIYGVKTITSNSIPHSSNGIDITSIMAAKLRDQVSR